MEKYIKDAYGTSIRSYMEAFGGYDTSLIVKCKCSCEFELT
jgi:hypothetical protein